MFQYGTRGAYCLGVIDSQWGGLLIGGVATRNVLVKVSEVVVVIKFAASLRARHVCSVFIPDAQVVVC
jgi:hypothetical protein